MRSIFKTVILGKGGGVAGPPPDPPNLTSITPDFGGIGDTRVIAGTDLDEALIFLGLDATSFANIVVDSAIQITVDVPSIAPGTYDVNITTAGGSDSLPNAFVVLDPDADAFLSAAGITTEALAIAVNDLVIDLKAASLWDLARVIYPIVGGTAGTHKFNLKDPQDTDGAFRLTFGGTVTHGATGMVSNGTTGFADTKFPPNSMGASSFSFGVYVRNNVASDTRTDLGATESLAPSPWFVNTRTTSDRVLYDMGGGSEIVAGVTDSRGLTMLNVDGDLPNIYRNGSSIGTGSNTTASGIGQGLYLMAFNNDGTAAEFSTRQLAFAWIGESLDATQNANLYTIVQAYQTALGRQV